MFAPALRPVRRPQALSPSWPGPTGGAPAPGGGGSPPCRPGNEAAGRLAPGRTPPGGRGPPPIGSGPASGRSRRRSRRGGPPARTGRLPTTGRSDRIRPGPSPCGAAPALHRPSPPGHAQADTVEPATERVFAPQPHRVGPAGEDKKDSLKGVFGGVTVARHAAADAQDHRPVAVQEGGEGRFGGGIAAVPREPGEQLGIGQCPDRAGREQDRPVIAARFRVRCRHGDGSSRVPSRSS